MELNQVNPLGQVQGVFAGESAGVFQRFSEPRRVHHTYVWLGALRMLAFLLFVLVMSGISNLAEIATPDKYAFAVKHITLIIAIGLGATVVLYGLLLLIRKLQFDRFSYQLTEDELVVKSGIITKRNAQVPYQRIQSVDQRAGLFQRLAGVCTVKISTAGGAANRGLILEYVLNADAQALREELFARKQYQLLVEQVGAEAAAAALAQQAMVNGAGVQAGGVVATGIAAAAVAPGAPGYAQAGVADGGAPGATSPQAGAAPEVVRTLFQEAPVTYAFGLSNKELILAGISNSSSVGVVIFGLISAIASLACGFVTASVLDGIVGGGIGMVFFVICAAVLLGSTIFAWVVSAITSCLRYGGFSAKRQGSRIEVQQGLVQRIYQGVDIDRVQSITIRQGFIRRLMGYCEISLGKIESIEGESGQNQQQQIGAGIVVHPFVKVDLIPQVIGGLVPEFAWVPEPQRALPPVAKRRALIRNLTFASAGFWLALVAALVQLVLNAPVGTDPESLALINGVFVGVYVFCALLIVVQVINGMFWVKESYFAYDNRGILVRNGGLNTTTTVIPRNKIQFAELKTNPFQRKAQVATLIVRTAAGVGGATTSLRDVAQREAEACYSWVEPRLSTNASAGSREADTNETGAPATPSPEGNSAVKPTFSENSSLGA